MGAALWIAALGSEPMVCAPSGAAVRSALLPLVGAGLLVYAVAVLRFGVIDLRQLRGLCGATRRRPPDPSAQRSGHLPLARLDAITRADS
jgi:hypothetical protein